MSVKHIALSLTLVCWLVGCAAAPGYIGPNRVRTSDAARSLQYRGFSVQPPRGEGWYLLVNEQKGDNMIFRKELSGTTHSFFVAVTLFGLRDGESIEQFGERLRNTRSGEPPRLEVLSSEQAVDHSGCVQYRIRLRDNGAVNAPGVPLELREEGLACVHPTLSGAVLNARVSERGASSELDDRLVHQGFEALRGVRLESAPGVAIPNPPFDLTAGMRWGSE